MTNNDNDIFENHVKESKARRAEKNRLEQEAKAQEKIDARKRLENRGQEIARLIALAEQNIRSLLADSEGKFLEYVTSVFKRQSGYSFEDSFGVCGFPQQPTQEASAPPVENVGAEGFAVAGNFPDFKPSHIRILPLYEENIPGSGHSTAFHMCDIIGPGSSTPEKAQILALAVRVTNGYSDATTAEIQKTRLVHLLKTSGHSVGNDDYDEAVPVSLDQGFIETLLNLITSTETAFEFFLERFGPPSDQKDPEY